MFFPYCDSFTTAAAAASYLIPLLRGKSPEDRGLAWNAAYTVASFGLGRLAPAEVAALEMPAEPMSLEQVADALVPMTLPSDGHERALQIPWQVLAPILLDLLAKWLAKRK